MIGISDFGAFSYGNFMPTYFLLALLVRDDQVCLLYVQGYQGVFALISAQGKGVKVAFVRD
ncbi:MAG: hypothetical protein RJQ14_09260 [Marinoscillum sp.]